MSSHPDVRLVFYPGERTVKTTLMGTSYTTLMGTIYVVGGHNEHFPAAGGPSHNSQSDGHTAGRTPPGNYILGPRHHHVTRNWTYSALPFGARLRTSRDGEVEYEAATGKWALATGPKGAVTEAVRRACELQHKTCLESDILTCARSLLMDPVTKRLLYDVWKLNDFGLWSWNLIKNGKAAPYFIHTTAEDEAETAAQAAIPNPVINLKNSHGCIHLKPKDRDKMIAAGYLVKGAHFTVRPYSEKGPPKIQN